MISAMNESFLGNADTYSASCTLIDKSSVYNEKA
jgi:hypothetical protein